MSRREPESGIVNDSEELERDPPAEHGEGKEAQTSRD